MRSTAFWVLLGGCAAGASDDEAFEGTAATDLAEVSRAVEAATGDLGDGDLDRSGTFEGVGDCVWPWTVAGPSTGAAFEAVVDAPCGGAVSGPRGTLDYAVTDGALSGTVALADGVWSYEIAGSRTADVDVDSVRREPHSYEATWTLESLVGTTDGQGAGAWDASLTWAGWLGGAWDVDWSHAGDGTIDGTITGPGGRTCDVSGTEDAVEVVCD